MNRVLTVILIVFFILLVNTASAQDKFRVSPTVSLRPVEDVIDRYQDGIVELYMVNPVLNDAMLSVVLVVTAPPSGIHVYGEDLEPGTIDEKNLVGIYEVPPGTARTTTIGIKADRFARLGYNTLFFYASYSPKYADQSSSESVSLTYDVNVKEASDEYQIAVKPTPISTPSSSYYSLNLVQGEEYSDSMELSIDPGQGSSYAWADASGDAASWVTPRRLDFGLIEEGTSEVRYYMIQAPEEQYPGTYELIWTRGCKEVTGETCSWKVDMIAYQITVEEKPTDASVKIGLAVFLFIGLYIAVRAVKGTKRREEKPAPVFVPAPTPVQAPYPAAPKKPQEPAAKPQADELKELKEKLSKTNQLLDKLDERLVNGELTEAKYRELAGKYKAEADSIKNLIAEKELLSEVGLKTE